MKKIIFILSVVVILAIVSCGGGDKEAKELLQRILSLIGIPQSIVVTICQDKNLDGICGVFEAQEKFSIKKGESLLAFFSKFENTADGKYLLETATPELPLLLVLKDSESLDYAKEFTIPFTGLEASQIEKNLSLLQAMVDAGYLTANEILPVETMQNQNIFYATLLKDFELNLKILTDKELSSPKAILANLEEVAIELKDAGIDVNLTNEIDACNDDVICVEELMGETIITEDEALVIENNETQKTKNTLANKVFYFSSFEEGVVQTEKTTVSSDATDFTWINVSGPGEGNTGGGTFDIQGNKVSLTIEDGYIALTTATEEYLVFDSYKNDDSFDIRRTYYFNRDDAEANLLNDNSKKLVKDLVSGHVTFKKNGQNTAVPSDAWIRFVPSRNEKKDNYNGVNCKIESNGNFGLECYVNNKEEQALRNDFMNTSETFQVIVYADTNSNTDWNKEEESYGGLGSNISQDAWSEFEINLNSESANNSILSSNTIKINWNNEELVSTTILSKRIEIRKKDENSGFAHIPDVKAKLDNGYTIYFKYCALNPTDNSSDIESLCTANDWIISLLDEQDNILYNNVGGFNTEDDPYNGKINGTFVEGVVSGGGLSGQFNIEGMAVI